MRNILIASLTLLGAAATGAWMRTDPALALQPDSRLWAEGTSTARAWSCKAARVDGDVTASSANAVAAVLNGEKAVRSVAIRIAAPQLDCGNGTMNEHMRKALKADQHKTITFRLTGYDVARAGAGSKGTMSGTLSLGGVERPVTIAATAVDGGAGQLRVAGTYELKMTDYGLKPPTLMMGTMKVGDKVTVGFDLLLKAAPPAAPIP